MNDVYFFKKKKDIILGNYFNNFKNHKIKLSDIRILKKANNKHLTFLIILNIKMKPRIQRQNIVLQPVN